MAGPYNLDMLFSLLIIQKITILSIEHHINQNKLAISILGRDDIVLDLGFEIAYIIIMKLRVVLRTNVSLLMTTDGKVLFDIFTKAAFTSEGRAHE